MCIPFDIYARNCKKLYHSAPPRIYSTIQGYLFRPQLRWWILLHSLVCFWPAPHGTAIQQKIRRFVPWACGLCTDLQQHVATHCGRAIAFACAVLGSLKVWVAVQSGGPRIYNQSTLSYLTVPKKIGAQEINPLQQFQWNTSSRVTAKFHLFNRTGKPSKINSPSNWTEKHETTLKIIQIHSPSTKRMSNTNKTSQFMNFLKQPFSIS